MSFPELVALAATLMEAVGVATMVLGAALAALFAGAQGLRRSAAVDAFRELRQNLGRAILLGLEFLVAADIIRTVSSVPTLRQIAVLGGIVTIRTFLSFTLEVELDGRWPWQRHRMEGAGRPPGRPFPRPGGGSALKEPQHAH